MLSPRLSRTRLRCSLSPSCLPSYLFFGVNDQTASLSISLYLSAHLSIFFYLLPSSFLSLSHAGCAPPERIETERTGVPERMTNDDEERRIMRMKIRMMVMIAMTIMVLIKMIWITKDENEDTDTLRINSFAPPMLIVLSAPTRIALDCVMKIYHHQKYHHLYHCHRHRHHQ